MSLFFKRLSVRRGPAILARLIGKGQSTVAYWQKVGTIPAKWQPILIDLAQRNAIGLTALDFIPVPMEDLKPAEDGSIPVLCRFDTGGKGDFKYAIGFPVERFIDLCSAYGLALQEHLNPASDFQLTARQMEIAKRAIAFERACAKVGIIGRNQHGRNDAAGASYAAILVAVPSSHSSHARP